MDKEDTEALGGMRSTERANPWKGAYSGLRFANHFCRRRCASRSLAFFLTLGFS
jgi:hypothetical protein